MPEQENDVIYNKLLDKVGAFVRDDVELPPLLFDALAQQEQSSGVTREELEWLQLSSEFVKKIINTELASTIVYYFNTKRTNATLRDLACKLDMFDCPVRYWLRKLLAQRLIRFEQAKFDKRNIYYIRNNNYGSIHRLMTALIVKKYGEGNLDSMINMHNRKSKTREANKRAIEKFRKKMKIPKTYLDSPHSITGV